VNVLCIAGFLGSGKTTVLLEVARSLTEAGARVAVIENEIGEVGVDGGYVREQGLPVQEIFGGCICCTLQIGLVQTLETLAATHSPDWVLLEPTGLASPGDILGLLVDHVEDLDVLRVLTVVDAARWPMLLEIVEPLVTAQLRSADVVAVNKADEVSAEALEAVLASVQSLASDHARVLAISAAKGAGMRALLRAAP
jgi:G3E family GTPase